MSSRYVVTTMDVLASARVDLAADDTDWYKARLVVRIDGSGKFGSRQIIVDDADHGASPERAIAFAMRKMADEILKEYPREFADDGKAQ